MVKGSMLKWRQGVRVLQGTGETSQSHSNKMKTFLLCQHVNPLYFLCSTVSRDTVSRDTVSRTL